MGKKVLGLGVTSNLNQWLSHLEMLHPKKIDLGLARSEQVAAKLGIKKFPCPVITVAGTNGKGSCIATLEAIFLQAGYKVGAYYSPHLIKFSERLHINGTQINDNSLCAAFQEVEQARANTQLTFFEFTTLAILHILQQKELDLVILEVGLGGRLDAVNIVDPDIAVITTIALDHLEWLGTNRGCIGKEKAGIMRANKPIICGDSKPPLSIFTHAKQISAELYCLNKDFTYQVSADTWQWQSHGRTLEQLPLTNFPIQNAATALMVTELIQPQLPLSAAHIKAGLENIHIPGRFQRLAGPIPCIVDVAHNPAAAEWLATQLAKQPCTGRTHAVLGVLPNKDIKGILMPMLQQVDIWYVGNLRVNPKGHSDQIIKILRDLGANQCYNFASIQEAYEHAASKGKQQDRVIVFGSFYSVGEVLQMIEPGNYK